MQPWLKARTSRETNRPFHSTLVHDGESFDQLDWLDKRVALLAQRDIDDIHRAVDYLNITTQWVQSKATDAQLENVTDALLLAMHDLRTVLVRKKADRLLRDEDDKKAG